MTAPRQPTAPRLFALLLVVGLLLGWPGRAGGEDASPAGVLVHFFWGDGCPHCAEARPVLEAIVARHAGADLRSYEVWYDEDNALLFARMALAQGFVPSGVPTILVGGRHWVGVGARAAREIEAAIEECLRSGCPDPGVGPPAAGSGEARPPTPRIELPWGGELALADRSLWVATLFIALVDGFNPCSLWVLSILIALSLRSGSRRRVLLIGLVFLTVTAAVYALFIAGLFTVLSIAGLTGWLRALVTLFALAFGLLNVKDYFYFHGGPSLRIQESRKPGLYRRMRQTLLSGSGAWTLVGATSLLAVAVSLIEFSCTAGFPVIWTDLVASQGVSGLQFLLLLLFYLLIYQLDELVIFLAAVFSLKAGRLSERQGRVLKLVGGMLMLTLAAVMAVRPGLMADLGSSLIVFAAAFAASLLVLLLHRRLLPRLGIRIGDEPTQAAQRPPPADPNATG